jgi:DNA-binding NarL/FixJ family response regulator
MSVAASPPEFLPRVLVVDSHALCREALTRLLRDDDRIEVVGAASPDDDVASAVIGSNADVVLIEVSGGQSTGLQVLRRLQESRSPVAAVLLTDDRAVAGAVPGVIAGARGVVSRNDDSALLVRSILGVARGEFWVSRKLFAEVLDTVRTSESRLGRPLGKNATPPSPIFDTLSPREKQIIAAVVGGQVNKEIAENLGISEYTVKHHLTRVFNKLNVTNRVELAMLAVDQPVLLNGD